MRRAHELAKPRGLAFWTRRFGGWMCVGLALWAIAPAAQAAPPYGSPGYLDYWTDYDSKGPLRLRQCSELTAYQLRQRVGAHGFVNIYIGGDIGRSGNVEVKATMDGRVFLLEVDKCSGKIEAATWLRG